MAGVARPVINFLNNMYPADLEAQPAERQVASGVRAKDFRADMGKGRHRAFSAKTTRFARTSVKVEYSAEPTELNRVRKKLRRPQMSPPEIGRHTFDHFLRMECPE
jgi:ribosomal protein L19E